jgi:putative ATP-binding cassette transporter
MPRPEAKRFALGPIDLTLRAGETVFVTGGNGSGKSPLIKLLTGLTQPHSGAMRIDGETVGPRNRRALRALVSPVLSDCHLFPRLYGPDAISPDQPKKLHAWMELDAATRLSGDRVEHLALSAGQKKRLALIAALLERRPLLVLDDGRRTRTPTSAASSIARSCPP